MTSFSATLKLGVGGGVGCCITAAHKWQAHVQSHVLNLLAKYFPPTVWKHLKKTKKGEGSKNNSLVGSKKVVIFWSKKIPFGDQKTFQIPRHRTVPQKWLSPSLWVSGSSGLWVSGFWGLWVSGTLGLPFHYRVKIFLLDAVVRKGIRLHGNDGLLTSVQCLDPHCITMPTLHPPKKES